MECLNVHLTVDAIIAVENTVAVRYTERGKSVKAFRGLGPTNRSYELLAMEWFEVKDHLIQRRWGARDSASQNRQLGFTD
jgi:predicted ester cyclase